MPDRLSAPPNLHLELVRRREDSFPPVGAGDRPAGIGLGGGPEATERVHREQKPRFLILPVAGPVTAPAKKAARILAGGEDAVPESIGELQLSHIKDAFTRKQDDALYSATLVEDLVAIFVSGTTARELIPEPVVSPVAIHEPRIRTVNTHDSSLAEVMLSTFGE